MIHSAVGTITETDVQLASASQGMIIGFHTRQDNGVSEMAKREGVEIRLYSVIYELIDDVKLAMTGLLEPVAKETVVGSAEVRQVFELSKGGKVAGCIVNSARIVRGKVRVQRRRDLIYEGFVSFDREVPLTENACGRSWLPAIRTAHSVDPGLLRGRYLRRPRTRAGSQDLVVDRTTDRRRKQTRAGSTLAADFVAKSASDGYTIWLQDMTAHAINATMYKRLSYDSLKDFAPITLVAYTPLLLVVHPDQPAKSVQELVAYLKANQAKSAYASAGSGNANQIAAELLKRSAGVPDVVHVPYKGSTPSALAVLSNQVTFSFLSMPPAVSNIQAGKMRGLAVTSSKRVGAVRS